ncbi:MlaD family protein [Nocardia huaxiensis]|uniref:MlaD family protein n=1 Tax=Nocardia huaxiensis TaxID=2755382 RepID=UPI001E3FB719|nr:MlaD family protein [Nocardia huaxiensis]UFS95947.1 MlaD family protein [Nocardia huaxiensis]
MLRRLLGSRGFVSIAGAVLVGVLAVAAYVVAADPLRRTETYCALMPDSIGLYTGNDVTMRGITVGHVTSVRPQGKTVRVEFEVEAAHPVLADASATTVSDSVVADRELAVLTGGKTTATWDRSQCITKTLTPKSLSQTLTALAKLSREVLGPDQARTDSLGRALTALNSATDGTGPQINAIINKLGSSLNSPDAAIGHLAGVVDALSSLSVSVSEHWGDIKSMLVRFAPALDQVNNELFSQTVEIIDGFQRVLPMLNDITTLFGDPIFAVLDATVPLVRFIQANVGSLQDIIARMPLLASAFTTVVNPATGVAGVTYAPPRVAVPAEQATQLCAAVNAVAPGRCAGAGDGMADLQLVQLVLGIAGAQ